LADGIVLERAGIPAVSLCTDAFRITAEAMASSLGFPGYQQLITSMEGVQIVVAGAPNAGVSSIVETFGPFDRPPAVTKIEEKA
jgi:hypothetical protein